jgi:hypothetical protein
VRRLLIRPGAIGDCILSLPALEFLKAGYTEVWVPGPVVPLIRFAARASAIASTGLDLLEISAVDSARVLARLREFDAIDSWYGAGRPEFRECVQAHGLPFRFFDALPPEQGPAHAADFFLRQVGGVPPAVPRIPVPPVERGGFVVIHPFSGSARKNWPLERFQELASRLPCPARWCAGPDDPEAPGAVRMENLYQLGCWLRSARCFIGNDSGIGHLAAAVGTPVVTIFGPMNPAVWAPRAERGAIVKGDLAALPVEVVLETALRVLADTE